MRFVKDNAENKYKNKILTIPNLLSLFRLCLIPVIIWLYIGKESYNWTFFVLLLSGLTDVVDGFIARKFHMVSDLGKIIDPIADKLTQATMLFCLVFRFPYMMIPFALLFVKEITTGITALISIKKTSSVKGAVWHGKITTVSLYAMMALHIIWYDIPKSVSYISVGICLSLMLLSFVLYTVQNVKAIKRGTFDN